MSVTIESRIRFTTTGAGQKKILSGPAQSLPPEVGSKERVQRVSRLMALAIHFDGLIRRGIVRDYADIARLGGTTRARVSQIMNLLNLAPEIQERLLFLPGTRRGRDPLNERKLREMVAMPFWHDQSSEWARLVEAA